MTHDLRVTAYIDTAAPFARPILCQFRDIVHAAVPGTTETLKWRMPFFELRGRPLAMMAAFKAHVGIGIFDGSLTAGDGMGQFGRLTDVAQLPALEVLVAMLGKAVALIETGAPTMRNRAAKPPLEVPADLRAALDAVPAAAAAFAGFPPGAQREYADWVTEAKQAATRQRRIATAVEWCSDGKRRYWSMAGR
jgi:uncharacterized protein YdeI (YjbR/CyaY-like superfamily)